MKWALLGMDLGIAIIFLLIGYGFYKSNGKASIFIAGYNSKSDEERKAYNEAKLCKDFGRNIMLWSICFLLGFVIDCFWLGVGSILEWIIWIILLIYYVIDMSKNQDRRYKK